MRDLYAAAVTGRPIVLFTYDLENYRDELRGFYFDLTTNAPGPLLRTSAEVVDALVDLEQVSATHQDAYTAFRQEFCHLKDGHATERVIDRLFTDLGREPAIRSITGRRV